MVSATDLELLEITTSGCHFCRSCSLTVPCSLRFSLFPLASSGKCNTAPTGAPTGAPTTSSPTPPEGAPTESPTAPPTPPEGSPTAGPVSGPTSTPTDTPAPTSTPAPTDSPVEGGGEDGFQLTLDLFMDASFEPAFKAAAARWETIVTGDLDSFDPNIGQDLPRDGCTYPDEVDDLYICGVLEPIDGPIVGFARPIYLRDEPGQLPYTGEMIFDSDELDGVIEAGLLNDLILHEMGESCCFFGHRCACEETSTPNSHA